jgi:uncharacterized protein YjaZ
MKYVLTFIISIFLFGCGQQSSQTSDSDKANIPVCKIIYLDNYYSNFLKAIKVDKSNRDNIYTEKIKDAIFNDHFSKSEYSELVLETISYPISDTSGLTKSISDLNANRAQVEKIISSAFTLCNKHLKNDNVIFYIAPSTSDMKDVIGKMGGVTGLTAGSKQVLLTIDFNVSSWKEVLEYSVAHEFHHTYLTNTNRNVLFKFTLLRYLIFEGMADSFAHLLYPEVKAPWTSSLTEKEKIELWAKIKPDLQNDNPTLLGEVMFGSKNYPIWGGYTLGYDIIQSASKNRPDFFKTNWTLSDDEKILELSGYN